MDEHTTEKIDDGASAGEPRTDGSDRYRALQSLWSGAHATSIVVAGAVIYGTGFIVFNTYMSGIGGASPAILRVQYIAAGLLFATFAICSWFFVLQHVPPSTDPLATKLQFRSPDPNELAGKITTWIFVALRVFVCSVIVTGMLCEAPGVEGLLLFVIALGLLIAMRLKTRLFEKNPIIGAVLFALGVSAVLVSGFQNMAYTVAASLASIIMMWVVYVRIGVVAALSSRGRDLVFPLFWTIVLVAISARWFGATVFPFVRRDIGGGSPLLVQLILKPDAAESAKKALDCVDGVSREVWLKAETDSLIVVTVEKTGEPSRVVAIDRSWVGGISRTEGQGSASRVGRASR